MATVQVRDVRREHFADLPEPRKEVEKVQHVVSDPYLIAIEKYIERLSDHVRKIQLEELAVTNQFSSALQSLQTKSHEKRRTREEVARDVYQKKITKIREKRRRYREMLYDAHQERNKLIASMQIQKEEDDILRRKLAKLNALNAGETSRELRKTSIFDKFAALFMVFQILLIVIYAIVVDFAPSVKNECTEYDRYKCPVAPYYQFYTDIALFALVGMGFLVTFLRKYQYSAVGFTLLAVAFSFQWTIIVAHFFMAASTGVWEDFIIEPVDLIIGMYGAVTVLITFGALIGIVSAFQLLLIAFLEIMVYGVNIYVCTRYLHTYNNANPNDTGASIPWKRFGFGGDATFVHVFGAYFGIAMAIPLGRKIRNKGRGLDDRADSYTSDLFAMIGTIFLWVLWPSFNAALAPTTTQHRVITNTILSLCAGVVFAFLGSRVFRGGKFDMIDIQNATLAGGVAMGSAAAIIVAPGSAMIIGAVASIFSSLGYAYLTPMMVKYGIADTRGVHNLHGIPGLIGALSCIVAIAIQFDNDAFLYGEPLLDFFPTGVYTPAWHLLSLVVTLAFAIVSGLLFGWVFSAFTKESKHLYTDETHWRVPGDFEVSPVEEPSQPAQQPAAGNNNQGNAAAAS